MIPSKTNYREQVRSTWCRNVRIFRDNLQCKRTCKGSPSCTVKVDLMKAYAIVRSLYIYMEVLIRLLAFQQIWANQSKNVCGTIWWLLVAIDALIITTKIIEINSKEDQI